MVAINRFPSDTDEEISLVHELATRAGAQKTVVNEGFTKGGEGGTELAEAVIAAAEEPDGFRPLTAPGPH